MGVVGLGLGLIQTATGLVEASNAEKDAERALAGRRRYQTPAELFKIFQATQNNAQTGFDPATLSYITNNINSSFDSALYTDQLLGGDPNSASVLFNNKVDAIMKVGGQDHSLRMDKFGQYLNATKMIADSKDAEFFSGQELVKDLQQKAAVDKQVATAQIGEGLSTVVSSLAALETEDLFTDSVATQEAFKKEYGNQWQGAYNYAKENNLSLKAYKKQSANNFGTLASII